MSLLTILLFVVSVAGLLFGAELLVRGAANFARSIGISSLVVGLTVVAYGTGSPELAVGVGAAIQGQPDLALGNVVGSNIFNVLIVLGLASVILPMIVAPQLVKFDVPLMIGITLATVLMCLDGMFGPIDGIIFIGGIITYSAWSIFKSRRDEKLLRLAEKEAGGIAGEEPEELSVKVVLKDLALVVGGLALLVAGARGLVYSASEIAASLGVSELVIGLTVVAVGTSLPEVFTSVVAARRGERDMAAGNVVGSNIFNLLAVLGAAAVVGGGIPVSFQFSMTDAGVMSDLLVMLFTAVLCLPIFLSKFLIERWEGILFLGLYVLYAGYLYLSETGSSIASAYLLVVVAGVVPLVLIAVTIPAVKTWREEARA